MQTIPPPLRFRLITFSSAISLLLLLMIWSAWTAWDELGKLRHRFTTSQFESFRISAQLQSRVLALTSGVLSYEVSGEPGDLKRIEVESKELDSWIDLQRAA